jgi:hypothetical protein
VFLAKSGRTRSAYLNDKRYSSRELESFTKASSSKILFVVPYTVTIFLCMLRSVVSQSNLHIFFLQIGTAPLRALSPEGFGTKNEKYCTELL